VKDYWPGYVVAAVGIVDRLVGGTAGLLLIGWGAGFLFAVVVHRARH
jgi:hypothetical protein